MEKWSIHFASHTVASSKQYRAGHGSVVALSNPKDTMGDINNAPDNPAVHQRADPQLSQLYRGYKCFGLCFIARKKEKKTNIGLNKCCGQPPFETRGK